MKKILLLNYEFPPLGGGASPVSYELAKRLSETGEYDIDAVTMGYKDLSQYEEVNSHFRIHRVRCLRSKKEICHPWEQLTYLFSGYFKCRELLKINQYDLCHTHFIIPTGVLALRLKKKFGLPYVITSHGSDVLGYSPRFKKLYPFLEKSWKKILDNSKNITTPSVFLKDEILKTYPIVASKIVVIPNGVDISKFQTQIKKNFIFSSGRLHSNKGFQYLIKAVAAEDIGTEVHIAGDGPMMGELKKIASISKTKIIFHGWLNNSTQEYKDLLEQASIFVSMSEKESFGVGVIEALSAGCAVVVSDIPAFRSIADNVLFVHVKDFEGLRVILKGLLSDSQQLKDMQQSAMEVVKKYDWSLVLKQYVNIL